jgi:WD40 repeat protein
MSNSAPDPVPESIAVHARIARRLAALADDPRSLNVLETVLQVPAYARRHLPEHAAAGGILNDRTVPTALLPFLDVTRLREVASSAELPLMPLVRKAAHAWAWEHPGQNAAALRFFATAERFPVPGADLPTPWRVAWAKSAGASDILARVDAVSCVDATSLDDRIVVVTGARNGRVDLWDMASGQSVQLPQQARGVNAITVTSVAGSDLVVSTGGNGGVVRCWLVRRAHGPDSWHDVQLLRAFDIGEAVTALAPAGLVSEWHVLAGQADGSVRLLDCASGTRLDRLVHEGEVTGLATVLLADETPVLVSVGVDASLQVSRLQGRLQAVGPRFWAEQAIRAVVTLRNDEGKAVAVTAGDGGSVQVWDLPPRPYLSRAVPGYADDVTVLTSGIDPQFGMLFVSGDSQGRIRLVDADEARIVGEPIEAHRRRITGLAFARSRNGRPVVISGGDDEAIRRWDLGDAIAGHSPGDRAVITSRDATGAARFPDLPVRAWRLGDGRELGQEMGTDIHRMVAVATARLADGTDVAVTDGGRPSGGKERIIAVSTATLPDGRIVAVSAATSGYLRVWSLPTDGEAGHILPLGRPLLHRGAQSVVTAVRADGRVAAVSGGRDRKLRIWDLGDAVASDRTPGQDEPQELAGHDRPVTALAVAASSDRPAIIVSGSEDTTLRTWDVDTGVQAGPVIRAHHRYITALAAAHLDGAFIAVTGCAGDGTVRAWPLFEQNPRPELLTKHEGPVTAVAISAADPRHPAVVTAGEDRTLRVWDLASARPLVDPMPVPGTVRAIACFEGAHPGAVIAGDDVLAVVHW